MGTLALLYFLVMVVVTIAAYFWPKQLAPIALVLYAVFILVCIYPFLRHLVVLFVEGMVR